MLTPILTPNQPLQQNTHLRHPAHIVQAFTCPCCGSQVVAFRWTMFRKAITLVNCMNTGNCPGASSLDPDAWCEAVGVEALPGELVLE